ncbi:MAG TPA: hypothetical protein VK044_06565 [Virgibacillus sp.]|nr:hypothetical protein [Virgibacillus sp.]
MKTSHTTSIRPKHSIINAFASKFAMLVFLTVSGFVILSFIGTRMFRHIDLNLYGYVVGTFVFIGGFFYRFIAWGERPPTKLLIKKGFKLLFKKSTPRTSAEHLVTHKFIRHRGLYRWTQHILIGGGCILACLVTFPLVFGWTYFTMEVNGYYTIVLMGIDLIRVKADGFFTFFFYNALNISSFMVISGVCMALYRRIKDMQARAHQSFLYDFLPLHLLLFVSVTGLALPFSNIFLAGAGHPAMSLIHEYSVIVTLIYLPFGKLAHIPFRPMSVFAKNYREHYMEKSSFECKVCGDAYVSTEQAHDVVDVLADNQIDFETKEGFHLAEMCLPCRRKYRIAQFSGIPTHQIKHKEANQHAEG